ncbi:MAG: CCA tRNA nucleotidyltransferase [bacterium]
MANTSNEHGIDAEMREAVARRIVERLQASGHVACFVGGYIRNRLMGLAPTDIDIATSARPDEVQTLFSNSRAVGAKFGVVLVIEQGFETEVATFRTDKHYLDHRHPTEVCFASPEEDARRRDFTINALFYDPVADKTLDYVGGLADLKARQLKCIGNPEHRFEEDALRLLRAVRFAIRFDLKIAPNTRAAIRKCAPQIHHISAERIQEELVRIFTGPRAGDALLLLDRVGLLHEILPEISAMKKVRQPREFHPEGDVFTHMILAMNKLDNPTPTLAFGLLLHDVGKPPTFEIADRIRFNNHEKIGAEMAHEICRRLKFSTDERQRIVGLVADHMKFKDLPKMRESTLRRFMAKPGFDEDLELHRLDCLASHGDLENYELCAARLARFKEEAKEIVPKPLLNGRDLQSLGYKDGPVMGKILAFLQEAQMENRVATPEEAAALVAKEFPLNAPN